MARSNNGNGSNHLLTTAMGVLNGAAGEWTMGFWVNLNALPATGNATYFYRDIHTTTAGGTTPADNLGNWMGIDPSGNVEISRYFGGGDANTPAGLTITAGSWQWVELKRKSNGDGTYSLIVTKGDINSNGTPTVLEDPFDMQFVDNGTSCMTVFFTFVDTDNNFNSAGLNAINGAFEDFYYIAGTALTNTQSSEAWSGRLANVSWLASTTCAYAFDSAATANEPDLSPNGFTLTVSGSLPKIGGPHSPSPVINSAVLNAARTAVNLVMNEAITGTEGLACYDETNGEWLLASSIDLTDATKPILNLASAVPNSCASLILATTPLLNRTSTVIATMDIYDEIEATGSITVGVLARCANWGESVDFYIDTGAGFGSATTVTTRSQNPTAPVRHDGYQPNNRFVHTFSLSGVAANTMCTVKAVCHGRNATDTTLTCRVLANPDWSTSTYYVDANATGTGDGSSWVNAFTSINPLFSIDGKFQALVNSGTYLWGTRNVGFRLSHDFFMRIRPKPGVDPSTVIIEYDNSADPRTARVLYNKVSVHLAGGAPLSNGVDPTETAYQAVTFDGCEIYSDYNAEFPTTPQLTNSGGLVTVYNCETHDFGYVPADGAVYIGGWIHHVYGHGINDGIALNVQVNDIQLENESQHGDILFGQSAGIIWADIYGLNAPGSLALFSQAPDGGPNMNNCLFENINLATQNNDSPESQIGKSGTSFTYSNIIARHVTINDGTLFFVCDGVGQTWTSNRMEQCAAQSIAATATIADNWVFDCKQVDGTLVATTYQTDTSDIQSTQGVALANVFMRVAGVGGSGGGLRGRTLPSVIGGKRLRGRDLP